MKGTEDTREIDRYIALDIHKEYVLAGGMNTEQVWILPPRRISMAKFGEWATANLHAGDAVVLETATNGWDLYDIVASRATRTVVAHAGAVRQIAEARVTPHGLSVRGEDGQGRCQTVDPPVDCRYRVRSMGAAGGSARVARSDLVP